MILPSGPITTTQTLSQKLKNCFQACLPKPQVAANAPGVAQGRVGQATVVAAQALKAQSWQALSQAEKEYVVKMATGRNPNGCTGGNCQQCSGQLGEKMKELNKLGILDLTDQDISKIDQIIRDSEQGDSMVVSGNELTSLNGKQEFQDIFTQRLSQEFIQSLSPELKEAVLADQFYLKINSESSKLIESVLDKLKSDYPEDSTIQSLIKDLEGSTSLSSLRLALNKANKSMKDPNLADLIENIKGEIISLAEKNSALLKKYEAMQQLSQQESSNAKSFDKLTKPNKRHSENTTEKTVAQGKAKSRDRFTDQKACCTIL